jgi:hypothetical protein
MPRYYFIVHALETIDDPEGGEYPGDAAALAAAVKIVREIRSDEQADFRGWSVEVRADQRQVAVIPFESVQ